MSSISETMSVREGSRAWARRAAPSASSRRSSASMRILKIREAKPDFVYINLASYNFV